jgi:excisionase family DNA binding protein
VADELLPLPAAAMVADVTEQWLRKLVKAGRIAGQRIGRNYLVSRAAVEHFKRHPTMGRPRFAPF